MPDQPSAPQQKRLYVICHGALAMLQTDQNLVLMIPDLGSKHSYRVGTWLAETTIDKGSLMVLQNVIGGSGNVPNLLTNMPVPSTAAKAPYATFVLPRPVQVFPLFQAIISKDALMPGPGATPLTADLIVPYLPVLEYGYVNAPSLGNVWPVVPDDLKGLPADPLTLHIYAEDEIEIDDAHAVDAFNLSCQLLGLNISLPQPTGSAVHIVTPGPLTPIPPGLENRCVEFQPLDLRRRSLLTITQAKQSMTSVTDPWGSLNCVDLQGLANTFFWPSDATIDGIRQDHNNASCLPVMVGVGADDSTDVD
jgi:hypothetical protein